jgi:hypothetical protein
MSLPFTNLVNQSSARRPAAAHPSRPDFADERARLLAAIKRLTGLSEHSPHIFASPLGPLAHGRGIFMQPRFIFFGENSAEEAWRVGIYAGLAGDDTRSSLAIVRTLERFVLEPDAANSFNLVFHPVPNPSGLKDGTSTNRSGQHLAGRSWSDSPVAELQLLERDARAVQYHGSIIVQTVPALNQLRGWVRGFSPTDSFLNPGVLRELGNSGYLPFTFPIQWQPHPEGAQAKSGLPTLVDDLRISPFEITLLVPEDSSPEWAVQAVVNTVRVFLNNFRVAMSRGMNI